MADGPSYDGAGLVNLAAELEHHLTGASPSPRLADGGAIPGAETYVLALFDGLGTAQLSHRGAAVFRSSAAGVLEAPFPTTTSVSLATLATGLPPSRHGQVAHLTWMPEVGEVVNSLRWTSLGGDPVSYDHGAHLPRPNLWERLRSAGAEPITVQSAEFSGTPLSRVLYRGCRFEGAASAGELVDAAVELASEPGRLIFVYMNQVDVAGHVHGLGSEELTDSMRLASGVWEGLAARLPPRVGLVGTADHGLVEFGERRKIRVRDPRFDELRLAGDARGVQMWGDRALMGDMASIAGGRLVDPARLVGPSPTETARRRLGEQVLMPPDDVAVIPRGFDGRLRCYHGGLSRAEVEIPLLVGP